MQLKPITININEYLEQFEYILNGSKIYDSSSSPDAKVIYIQKHNGYFLKIAAKNALQKEYLMTKYYSSLGLTCNIISYISSNRDYLLTEKIKGNDCIFEKYLENPKKLCNTIAELLAQLHSINAKDCPIPNHSQNYLNTAISNYKNGKYDKTQFPDSFGYKSEKEALQVIDKYQHLLKDDTLIHGDYCLPNIILNNWKFSGFIDLGNGGIGDKHVDIFWGLWTLYYNLKTFDFTERFMQAYGKDKIDFDTLRLIAAIATFG